MSGERRKPLALAAQQRPEAEPVIERPEGLQIRDARAQLLGARFERHVAHNAGQAARQIDRLTVLVQPLAQLARAAQTERGDSAEAA